MGGSVAATGAGHCRGGLPGQVGRIDNAKLRAEEMIRAELLTPPPRGGADSVLLLDLVQPLLVRCADLAPLRQQREPAGQAVALRRRPDVGCNRLGVGPER